MVPRLYAKAARNMLENAYISNLTRGNSMSVKKAVADKSAKKSTTNKAVSGKGRVKKAVAKKPVAKQAIAKTTVHVQDTKTGKLKGSYSNTGKKKKDIPSAQSVTKKAPAFNLGIKPIIPKPTLIPVNRDITFTPVTGFQGSPLFGWDGGDNVDKFVNTLTSLNKEELRTLSNLHLVSEKSENYGIAVGSAHESLGNWILREDFTNKEKAEIISYLSDQQKETRGFKDDFYELEGLEKEWHVKSDDLIPKKLNKTETYEYEGALAMALETDMALRAFDAEQLSKSHYNTVTKNWRKYVGALRREDKNIYVGFNE